MLEWDFRGRDFFVKVLYSRKGIATQILLKTEEIMFLFDCGDGTLRDLIGMGGFRENSLFAIFLSHLHSDHSAGLYALLSYLRLKGRKDVLHLGCPDQSFFSQIRHWRDSIFAGFPFELQFWLARDRSHFSCPFFDLEAVAVPHREWAEGFKAAGSLPSVSFTLRGNRGEHIFYTGDTGWCPGLKELARGADLALIEATLEENRASDRHLTRAQAEAIGQEAKEFILIHR